jgi:hypothetical protein
LWGLFVIEKANMTVFVTIFVCRGWDVVILKQMFVYNQTKVWMFGKIKGSQIPMIHQHTTEETEVHQGCALIGL